MSPYELADELENKPLAYGDCIQDWLLDAANMLRQQADELKKWEEINERQARSIKNKTNRIAELEKLVDELAEYKESYENCHRMCNGYGMN